MNMRRKILIIAMLTICGALVCLAAGPERILQAIPEKVASVSIVEAGMTSARTKLPGSLSRKSVDGNRYREVL